MRKSGKKKDSSVDVREIVLEALLVIARQEEYSHVVMGGILDKYNYPALQEKTFMKRLLEGTLERRIQLDYCIDGISSVPVKKMKPFIRELLRMSAYQLLFMDSVPDSAVCNEAVKLADSHSFHALKGFVNGVLRNLSRKKGEIVWPDREKDRLASLSVCYSMPRWLVEKWDSEQGKERTEPILQGLLQERPVTVRLKKNLTAEEIAAVRTELESENIRVKEIPDLSYAWHLERVEGLKNIPAFLAGKFTVQDGRSMLAVEAAGIREGDCVIDVCAAPGGKTMLAAELAGGKGQVLARDISLEKLALIEENRDRMGADNVTVEQWDAAAYDREKAGLADVVLADVPCSGLGVIGKKRDIKYRITPERIEALVPLQRQILETVWQYVKPGGVLLYSTCTVSRAENEEMVQWFLSEFPFHAGSLTSYLPKQFAGETLEKGYYQFLPGMQGTDGFFIARFVRD